MRLVIFTHELVASINEPRCGRDLYDGAFSSETFFHGPIALMQMVIAAMKLKDTYSLEIKL